MASSGAGRVPPRSVLPTQSAQQDPALLVGAKLPSGYSVTDPGTALEKVNNIYYIVKDGNFRFTKGPSQLVQTATIAAPTVTVRIKLKSQTIDLTTVTLVNGTPTPVDVPAGADLEFHTDHTELTIPNISAISNDQGVSLVSSDSAFPVSVYSLALTSRTLELSYSSPRPPFTASRGVPLTVHAETTFPDLFSKVFRKVALKISMPQSKDADGTTLISHGAVSAVGANRWSATSEITRGASSFDFDIVLVDEGPQVITVALDEADFVKIDPLVFTVSPNVLKLSLEGQSGSGNRVGDVINLVLSETDSKGPISLAVLFPLDKAGKQMDVLHTSNLQLTDDMRKVEAFIPFPGADSVRYANKGLSAIRDLFDNRDPLAQIDEIVAEQNQTTDVALQTGPAVGIPLTFLSNKNKIPAQPLDAKAMTVTVSSDTGSVSNTKLVPTGNTLTLSVLPVKPGIAHVTLRYDEKHSFTITLTISEGVVEETLTGNFIPLSDLQVSRLYGPKMAKAYSVIECTLLNDVKGNTSTLDKTIIVQPAGLEFGAILHVKIAGVWRVFAGAGGYGGMMPGATLDGDFTAGSILNTKLLHDAIFSPTSPVKDEVVIALLRKKMVESNVEVGGAQAAKELNTAISQLASDSDSEEWAIFASKYKVSSTPLLSPTEKKSLIRRQLEIALNGAIATEIPYIIWKPLSPEAVLADFEVLAKREPEQRLNRLAQLVLAGASFLGNSTFLSSGARQPFLSDLSLVSTGVLPALNQAFPDMTDARRKTLTDRLFSGSLRLAPMEPTVKHIFVSKEVLKLAFGADEVRIAMIVPGTLKADVAVVTSTSQAQIKSTN